MPIKARIGPKRHYNKTVKDELEEAEQLDRHQLYECKKDPECDTYEKAMKHEEDDRRTEEEESYAWEIRVRKEYKMKNETIKQLFPLRKEMKRIEWDARIINKTIEESKSSLDEYKTQIDQVTKALPEKINQINDRFFKREFGIAGKTREENITDLNNELSKMKNNLQKVENWASQKIPELKSILIKHRARVHLQHMGRVVMAQTDTRKAAVAAAAKKIEEMNETPGGRKRRRKSKRKSRRKSRKSKRRRKRKRTKKKRRKRRSRRRRR
jgi:hypothetical protein